MRSWKIYLMVSTKKGARKLGQTNHPARGRENVFLRQRDSLPWSFGVFFLSHQLFGTPQLGVGYVQGSVELPWQ